MASEKGEFTDVWSTGKTYPIDVPYEPAPPYQYTESGSGSQGGCRKWGLPLVLIVLTLLILGAVAGVYYLVAVKARNTDTISSTTVAPDWRGTCSDAPCLNGGTCVDSAQWGYECECPVQANGCEWGAWGINCEDDLVIANKIKVTYTVENKQDGIEPGFSDTATLCIVDQPLIDIMRKAATIRDTFKFESKYFEGLGESIQVINNVRANHTLEVYWALMRKVADGEYCTYNKGASTYRPFEGEHVVASLEKYNLYEYTQACPSNVTSTPH